MLNSFMDAVIPAPDLPVRILFFFQFDWLIVHVYVETLGFHQNGFGKPQI